MLHAKDLRVGNYIYFVEKVVCCTANTIYAVSKIVPPTKVYSPIPLTEEWLVRFNEAIDKNYTIEFNLNEDTLVFSWASRRVDTGYRSGWSCDKFPYISSVHQLQNLYYALTGEELTLKN